MTLNRYLNLVSKKTPWFITACLVMIVVTEENLFKQQAKTTSIDCTANRSDVIRQVATLDREVTYFLPLEPETKNATELFERCETMKAWGMFYLRGHLFVSTIFSLIMFLRAVAVFRNCEN